MLRKEYPYQNQQYLIDTSPLSKTIHDLSREKKSCNIHKIITPDIHMYDTMSEINRFYLLNKGYVYCKCCFPDKYK